VDLSSLLQAVGSLYFDDVLVWGVGAIAGVIALVAVANAIDMYFFDTEAGRGGTTAQSPAQQGPT